VRPNVTEQLQGLRRILTEVVAPELTDPYPADILAGVCATLDALATGWLEVPGYLRWDSDITAGLLAELLAVAPGLDPAAASIEAAGTAPDPADVEALEAHHVRVREALVLAVPALTAPEGTDGDGLDDLRRRVAAHLRERATRYPLRTVWRPPTQTPANPGRSDAH
jgi:hypothetical protein